MFGDSVGVYVSFETKVMVLRQTMPCRLLSQLFPPAVPRGAQSSSKYRRQHVEKSSINISQIVEG